MFSICSTNVWIKFTKVEYIIIKIKIVLFHKFILLMSLRDFVILTKIGKPRFITAYFS